MILISNGICQYERKYAVLNKKYMPFFGIITERHFWEKIKSTETYTKLFNAALWIFSQNTLGDGPAFWIFFKIYGYGLRVAISAQKVSFRNPKNLQNPKN